MTGPTLVNLIITKYTFVYISNVFCLAVLRKEFKFITPLFLEYSNNSDHTIV